MQPNKPRVALMGAIISTIQVILIVSVVRDLQTSARATGFPAAMAVTPSYHALPIFEHARR